MVYAACLTYLRLVQWCSLLSLALAVPVPGGGVYHAHHASMTIPIGRKTQDSSAVLTRRDGFCGCWAMDPASDDQGAGAESSASRSGSVRLDESYQSVEINNSSFSEELHSDDPINAGTESSASRSGSVRLDDSYQSVEINSSRFSEELHSDDPFNNIDINNESSEFESSDNLRTIFSYNVDTFITFLPRWCPILPGHSACKGPWNQHLEPFLETLAKTTEFQLNDLEADPSDNTEALLNIWKQISDSEWVIVDDEVAQTLIDWNRLIVNMFVKLQSLTPGMFEDQMFVNEHMSGAYQALEEFKLKQGL